MRLKLAKVTYPVLTGKADFLRLSILNKIYNPTSFDFLKKFIPHRNLTVLEVGCGYGDMAFKLAKYVGQQGTIIAIDQDINQIEIARSRCKKKGITNIEFICSPLQDLPLCLKKKFDFIYMRWTLMFMQDPLACLSLIYDLLQPAGHFVCEDVSVTSNGVFTCPQSDVGERWTNIVRRNFDALGLHLDLAGALYGMLTQLGFTNIDAQLHQPILKTKREKSIFRLGVLSTKENIIENKAINVWELDSLIKDLEGFENCNKSIVGYMRNLMIGAEKQL